MDQVNLEFKLLTDKADAAMANSARKGRDLFEKKGFKLNVKTGDLPLGRITGDFEKFQGSLDAATARVLAFTATTGVVYGLSSAFTRLFTDSVKLEKQLASIQAILQTSNSNLKQFSDELFNVANSTGQSFDVAASAASEFARQGLSVEETLKATTSALVFSKIAGVDAAQAVENLTASINTFGNEALSYTDVVDTIVSLDNAFAISAGGIADGLKRVGSVASESGIQLKEIASLISVVQQVSARGAPVISNGLKTIFTRLGRQKVQESLNGIGVATQGANGEFRSQIDILTDLSTRLDTLSDSQRAFILEQVAGVYQINTLQATLKSLSGEYSLYDKAVKVASDSSGNAAERLKILTDTTDANLQRLKNNVTQFLAETGKATVKPLLDNFLGIGNKILETLNLGSASKEGEDKGFSIGSSILNGISAALSGPGTILIIATVARLLGKITKDALSALETLSGLKNASLVDSQTQKSINDAIAQGNKVLVDRLSITTSIVEKTDILNKLLSAQANKQGIAQVNQAVTTGLAANKKTGSSRGKSKGFIPSYFGGFIPKNIERQEQMGARSGGYVPGDVVPSPVGGVMNTAESVVYASSKYEPFINPPENSIAGINHKKKSIESTGINPYGLQKGLASGGFIPNFAIKSGKSVGIAKPKKIVPEETFEIGGVKGTRAQNQFKSRTNQNVEPDDKIIIVKSNVEEVNFSSATSKLKSQEIKDSSFLPRGTSFEIDAIEHFKNQGIDFQSTGMFGASTSAVDGYRIKSLKKKQIDLLEVKSGSYSKAAVDNKFKRFVPENINKLPVFSQLYTESVKGRQDEILLNTYLAVPAKGKKSEDFVPNFASKYTEARQQKRDELRGSLFNVVDFAGAAIKNVNAQTEFNQARNENPNIEWDDKINQVGFKVERIPIPDREFEAALRSKSNNREITTKFENYSIDYLNKKGYSFKAGRNTLYGKENASVDGYNIKQNFIELLEVKGGGWDAPEVSNKFGRFVPENLVDLAPQLVSKFFKEGDPDPNINDKIRIRNVLAIPALTGGVFKSNINAKYPSADLKAMEKQRQKKTGNKIPAKFAWMKGIIDQGPVTNSSGFIPNFSQYPQAVMGLEEEMSGQKATYSEFPFPHIRNKSQPTFGSAIADHGGLKNAMRDSLAGQQSAGLANRGFIPNFATLRPPIDPNQFLRPPVGPSMYTGKQAAPPKLGIPVPPNSKKQTKPGIEKSTGILRALVNAAGILYFRDGVLGDAFNGQETDIIEQTIKNSAQLAAAYTGQTGVGRLVKDAAKYGINIAGSLKNRLAISAGKTFGPKKISAEGFIPNFAKKTARNKRDDKRAEKREKRLIQQDAKEQRALAAKEKAQATIAKPVLPTKGIQGRGKGTEGYKRTQIENRLQAEKDARSAKAGKLQEGRVEARKPIIGMGNAYTGISGSLGRGIRPSLRTNEQDANRSTLAKTKRELRAIDKEAAVKKAQTSPVGKAAKFLGITTKQDKVNQAQARATEMKSQTKMYGLGVSPSQRTEDQKNARKGAALALREQREELKNKKGNYTPQQIEQGKASMVKEAQQRRQTNRYSQGLSSRGPGAVTGASALNMSGGGGGEGSGGGGRGTGGGGRGPSGGGAGPRGAMGAGAGMGARGAMGAGAAMGAGGGMGGSAALIASMAIPALVAGFAPEEGKRSKGQQAAVDVAESAGSGMMAASMVSMVPQLAKFGPAIGLAVAGVALLSKSAKNAVPSIQGLQKENDKLVASNEKQVTSLNEAVVKQEEISQLKASGADPKKIARAQLDFAKSVSGIGDTELQNTLLTEKDSNKRQEAVMKFQEKKKNETAVSQGVLATAALSREKGLARVEGVKGVVSQSQEVLSSISKFVGMDSAAQGYAQNAELLRGPKEQLTSTDFDTFLNPIVQSLDLSKLSSEEAATGLKQLAAGTMDMGTFITKFGEELGLSSGQVQKASETFSGLNKNFTQSSINSMSQYAGEVIKLNSSISKAASKPPVININFQKVFDKALQDLTFDTALTNYKKYSNADANLDIADSQLAIDQELGQISPQQMIRKKTELAGQRSNLEFEQKSTGILEKAVQGVLAVIPKNLDQGTQSSIVSAAKSSLTQGGDITVLQDIIKKSLGASEDSNQILAQIEALNQETVQSLEMLNVDMASANKVREAQAAQQIAAIQAQKNIGVANNALAGGTEDARADLIDPAQVAKIEKEIKDLEQKGKTTGGKKGMQYREQASQKKIELAQMRETSRAAEEKLFGTTTTPELNKQQFATDQKKTNIDARISELVSQLGSPETGAKVSEKLAAGNFEGAKEMISGQLKKDDGSKEGNISKEIMKLLGLYKEVTAPTPTPTTPTAGAPAAGMPSPQMPGVSVPGATSATGAPAAVGSPSATGTAPPQIPGTEIPSSSPSVSAPDSALARLRDNVMIGRVGQQDILDQAAKDKSIQEAQVADQAAKDAGTALSTFDQKSLQGKRDVNDSISLSKLKGVQDTLDNALPESNWYDMVEASDEDIATRDELQGILGRVKEGNFSQKEFEDLQASSKQYNINDRGEKVKNVNAQGVQRSERELSVRAAFVQGLTDSGVKFKGDDQAEAAERARLVEQKKIADEKAKQKREAATSQITRLENQAADPTGTFEFLKDPKEKKAALEKFKQSKDPRLQELAKKIEQDDLNKERVGYAKELTKKREGEIGQTVEDVRMGLSSQDLSPTDTIAANEALNKFKSGEIGIEDESLKKYGLTDKLKQTNVETQQKDYQAALQEEKAARDRSLASGKAVRDMGQGAIGAVNSTLYGNQVTPGIMAMVKDPKGQKAIKDFNASVVQRDAKREELSGVDASLQEAQSADTLRQQAASKVKGDLSKASAGMKPEQLSQYQDTQYALSQYRSGKIDIKDKSLDSVRGQLIDAAGGTEEFNKMNSKSGKTEDLQAKRDQIAKALASEESNTSKLEAIMMEYLKTVTGAANQRDTAESMGPDGKPKGAETTTEKKEITSNVNIKIEGSGVTPELESQIRPIIVAEIQNTLRESNKNSGQPPPQTGPVTAVA